MAASAPLLHDQVAENALVRWSRDHGDVDGAFAGAGAVVSQSFHIRASSPLRSRRGARSRATIPARTSSRSVLRAGPAPPPRPARPLARPRPRPAPCDRPGRRRRLREQGRGGRGGGRGRRRRAELGRPIRWTEDRTENFLASYQGRGLDADVELALAPDGRILGLRAVLYADLGGYLYPITAVSPHTTAMLLCGTYRIPAVSVEVVGAATTRVPTGPYRGAGRLEDAFLIERMVDLGARRARADLIEVRRRNFLTAAFPDPRNSARLDVRLGQLLALSRCRARARRDRPPPAGAGSCRAGGQGRWHRRRHVRGARWWPLGKR